MKRYLFSFGVIIFLISINYSWGSSGETQEKHQKTQQLVVFISNSNPPSQGNDSSGSNSPWNLGKQLFGAKYKPWTPEKPPFANLPVAQATEQKEKAGQK